MFATNRSTTGLALPSDMEIVITRLFDARRELVWKLWTDPRHVTQWWGPKGFTGCQCDMDLRVGGAFQLSMCGPDGTVYPCKGTYREIVEPELIVYSSEAHDSHPCGAGLPPRSLVTITFAEQEGKTKLTIHTRFESVAGRDAAVQGGFNAGWASALERLEEWMAD